MIIFVINFMFNSKILLLVGISVILYLADNGIAFGTPFYENNAFTANGIEWCEENFSLYNILGDKFFEHHKYSLESRVCASLYNDSLWNYTGPDRVEKLIEKSRYYSQLEIAESASESKTGVIDPTPAARDQNATIIYGSTLDETLSLKAITDTPQQNKQLKINFSFLNKNGNLVTDVNFDIEIIQQNKTIFSKKDDFSKDGLYSITTRPLTSSEPVHMRVNINGLGDPQIPNQWVGSKGQIIMFTIVPEFGQLAIMILVISLVSFLVISKKSHFYRIYN
jgi:predicted secreted protein with PEFG-CTERM motif